jgi:hypothetical protein
MTMTITVAGMNKNKPGMQGGVKWKLRKKE